MKIGLDFGWIGRGGSRRENSEIRPAFSGRSRLRRGQPRQSTERDGVRTLEGWAGRQVFVS